MDNAQFGKYLGLIGGLLLTISQFPKIGDFQPILESFAGVFASISIYLIGHVVHKNGGQAKT